MNIGSDLRLRTHFTPIGGRKWRELHPLDSGKNQQPLKMFKKYRKPWKTCWWTSRRNYYVNKPAMMVDSLTKRCIGCCSLTPVILSITLSTMVTTQRSISSDITLPRSPTCSRRSRRRRHAGQIRSRVSRMMRGGKQNTRKGGNELFATYYEWNNTITHV